MEATTPYLRLAQQNLNNVAQNKKGNTEAFSSKCNSKFVPNIFDMGKFTVIFRANYKR